MVDRAQLADFLRRRREALQPEDVGIGRGSRRRTSGLRREEVAALCDMSVDYYSRLEQRRGPQPSEQMLASIARGLRLTQGERDHLFRLAGHTPPARVGRADHVSPAMMRILDRLADTPAQVMTELGETLAQTALARTLFGDETLFTGHRASVAYRWFTDPRTREVYRSTIIRCTHVPSPQASGLSTRSTGARSRAGQIVDALRAESPEFVEYWEAHEVRDTHGLDKRLQHPEVGVMELQCQTLVDPDQSQTLLVLTAAPGTESYEKLQLLSVIGSDLTG